jgi:hypothetical protein
MEVLYVLPAEHHRPSERIESQTLSHQCPVIAELGQIVLNKEV